MNSLALKPPVSQVWFGFFVWGFFFGGGWGVVGVFLFWFFLRGEILQVIHVL